MIGAAARAGGFDTVRPRAPRAAMLAGVVALHLAGLLLVFADRPGVMEAPVASALAVFDVAPPPPPLPPPPAIRPPEPEPIPAPVRRTVDPGGSPGRRRERAAVMVDRPRPPERAAMDATLTLDAPALPAPAVDAGTAALDLGRGGADGIGTGSGAGRGDGDGSGRGGVAYTSADWIERPSNAAWLKAWPRTASGQLRDVSVSVLLGCYVKPNGNPYRCTVIRTVPENPVFGRAAQKLVIGSRVRPVRRNGGDVNTPVFIPVNFIDAKTRLQGMPSANAPPAPTAAASAPRAR